MLAHRIIPVVLARGHQAVKGKVFDSWRSVGQLRQAIRVYEMRNVDELCLLNIGATPNGEEPDIDFVREFCSELFCPVTVGGGVKTVDDVKALLANGADKVAINTAAVIKPNLITEAAEKFGSQAVVVSIDVKYNKEPLGEVVIIGCGKTYTKLDPVEWAKEVERRGAGEILLNSIDRDGTLSGYDLDLVERVSGAVGIPVVACGGAGTYEHMREALLAGAHAVAAGAIWHFTDSTPAAAAEYLHEHGIPVRRKIAA